MSGERSDPVAWPEDPAGRPAVRRGPNTLAVASLVLSILWIFGVGSIAAVVLGWIAMRQIEESGGAQDGMTVALAGVVLGLVGIAVLLVYLAL